MKTKDVSILPLHLQQVMVALELEQGDNHLLDYFDFFAQRVPIEAAHFLHVLPSFDVFNTIMEEEGQSLISNFEINEEVLNEMKAELKQKTLDIPLSSVSLDIREGNPLEELLKDATEVLPDLVLIGQKGGNGEHGILAGNLARKTKGNVLIVPEAAPRQLNRIVVPIDFSSYSVKALKMAIALKKQLGEHAKVIGVHVFKMPDISVYRIQKTYQQLEKMIEADHKEALQRFIEQHTPEIANEAELILINQEEPGIAHYILEAAQNADASMVVMGAKGYSRVELLLMGSVTEKLLSINKEIPTLVVK